MVSGREVAELQGLDTANKLREGRKRQKNNGEEKEILKQSASSRLQKER